MTGDAPPLRAALFGTGRAGAEIVRAAALRPEQVTLVAAVAVDPGKEGADLGAITVGEPNGVRVTCDLEAALATGVDLLFHTGLGEGPEVADVLGRCADAGVDAITVNGLIHPVSALGEAGAAALDERARRGGARIVGTGVNPGFLLDALPVIWGSMVTRIDRLAARRVSDITHWGAGTLDEEVGVGRPPSSVHISRSLAVDGSLAVVVDALGLDVDRCEDRNERLPAATSREHGGRVVAAGDTVGFRHRSVALRGDDVVAEVEWIGIFALDPAVDGVEESATLEIDGDVRVAATCSGTFFGDPYPSTAARALNAAGPLRDMAPGVYRPDQIPMSRRVT